MKRNAVWPVLLAVFLLAGCVKTKYTPVNAQTIAKTVEKYDALTQTVQSGDSFSADYPEALIARVLFANEKGGWSGEFWEFDSETAAKACFARLNGAAEPSFSFVPSDEYDRFEITLADGAQPVLKAMRVQNTVLLVSCRDTEESRGAVSKLLVTLGYN